MRLITRDLYLVYTTLCGICIHNLKPAELRIVVCGIGRIPRDWNSCVVSNAETINRVIRGSSVRLIEASHGETLEYREN